MSNVNGYVKLNNLVKAITTVATCSDDKDVNLEALMTFGQIMTPTPRPLGRRRSYNPVEFPENRLSLTVTDDDEIPEDSNEE